jgi:hypothetical protein
MEIDNSNNITSDSLISFVGKKIFLTLKSGARYGGILGAIRREKNKIVVSSLMVFPKDCDIAIVHGNKKRNIRQFSIDTIDEIVLNVVY